MKVSPLATGTGTPGQSSATLGRTADPSKIAKAKAIAAGETPVETQQQEDPQFVKPSLKSIKMKTQRSTNRHTAPEQEVTAEPVESAITDTVQDEPVESQEDTRTLDPQVARIIKAKRALQVKERELEEREAALKTQPPGGAEDFKAKLKASPLSVLLDAGVTYDQLTEEILAQQNAPIDSKALREQIKEELKEELKGEFNSRDELAEKQVLAAYESEINVLVKDNERYELIQGEGAQKDVVALIHRVFKEEEGRLLDVEEAADIIEEELFNDSLKRAQYKKVQSKLSPTEQTVERILADPKPGTRVMRTLTNRDSSPTTMDKRTRAIAAMEGRLKR